MTDAPHILVVDDDKRLRSLLRKYLSDNGFVVSTAGDAAEARRVLDSLQFDVIVMDVMMPGETGLELTRALRNSGETPILLLTAMGGTDDRIAGLESGADDYLPKPFEPRELLLRLHSILRRAPPPSAEIAQVRFGEYVFDQTRQELTRQGEQIHLTSAETGLLAALAAEPGRILSREDLQALTNLAGNERTVDVQVTRLRRKLEANPRLPRYLVTVRGEGYALRCEA
jgi:two-component system phosphate regulon response regulator OmpR